MKNLTRGILFLIIALALGLGSSLQAADSYAAVAFSPSTLRWGYGNGYPNKAQAISRARSESGSANAKASWAKNAWIALAVSDRSRGGYGMGWATTASGARSRAVAQCRKFNPDARVVVCVSAYR
jgi:hypothetical protein